MLSLADFLRYSNLVGFISDKSYSDKSAESKNASASSSLVSVGSFFGITIDLDVRRLFPNFHALERDYYRRTRIFPIMHLVALRRDVYEKHPFIATSLYKAMSEAKDLALTKMRNVGTLRYMLPGMLAELDEIDDTFGGDPWPYGVEANRPTLEALVRYMAEQSLIKAPIPVEDLFVPIYGQ